MKNSLSKLIFSLAVLCMVSQSSFAEDKYGFGTYHGFINLITDEDKITVGIDAPNFLADYCFVLSVDPILSRDDVRFLDSQLDLSDGGFHLNLEEVNGKSVWKGPIGGPKYFTWVTIQSKSGEPLKSIFSKINGSKEIKTAGLEVLRNCNKTLADLPTH